MYRSRTENASKYIYSTYASRDVINVDILLQAVMSLHKLHREGKGGGGGGGARATVKLLTELPE